jgi:hypothetical protein
MGAFGHGVVDYPPPPPILTRKHCICNVGVASFYRKIAAFQGRVYCIEQCMKIRGGAVFVFILLISTFHFLTTVLPYYGYGIAW